LSASIMAVAVWPAAVLLAVEVIKWVAPQIKNKLKIKLRFKLRLADRITKMPWSG
jgi:hypothetical protein